MHSQDTSQRMSYSPDSPSDDLRRVSSECNVASGYKSQLTLYFPRTNNFTYGGGFFVSLGPTSTDDYVLMNWALQMKVRVFHHPSGTVFYNQAPSDGVHYRVGGDGEFYGYRYRKARKYNNMRTFAPPSDDPSDNKNKLLSAPVDQYAVRADHGLLDNWTNSCVVPGNIWAPGVQPGGKPSSIWSNFTCSAPGQIWGPGLYPGDSSFQWSNHSIVTITEAESRNSEFADNPINPQSNDSCVANDSIWTAGIYSFDTSNNMNNYTIEEVRNVCDIWGDGACPSTSPSNTMNNLPSVAPDNAASPCEEIPVKDFSGSRRATVPLSLNASYEPLENCSNPPPVTNNAASAGNTRQRKNRNKNKRAQKEFHQRTS